MIAAHDEEDRVDDIELGEPADLPGILERIVVPVVQSMIRRTESIDAMSLRWEGEPPSRGRSDLILSLLIENEPFRWVALTQGATAEDELAGRARLASELQDFIAESGFARGQLRPHPF